MALTKEAGGAVAVSVLLLVGQIAESAGVFLHATGADAPSAVALDGMHRRVRDAFPPLQVRVIHAELERARDQAALLGSGQLLFNLGHAHLRGVVERAAPTLGGYSLSGRIDEPGGGFVTFAVHGEAVAGAIWTPDASYEIVPRGGGLHVVRPAAAPQCAGAAVDGDAFHFKQPPSLVRNTGAADDGSNTVVDVLVAWTPEREELAGGEDEARAVIDLGIAYANDAFERSGAFVSLNLVGAERVDYVESTPTTGNRFGNTDLARLADPSDGHMDDVHDRRDALRADLVSLAVAKNTGIAHLLGAFSISGPYAAVFAHEVGHNFGIVHDRSDRFIGPQIYGFAAAVVGPRCVGTLMGAARQCRGAGFPDDAVPYFSSPWRHDPRGFALGVWRFADVAGLDGAADAVAALNRNRRAVASFR